MQNSDYRANITTRKWNIIEPYHRNSFGYYKFEPNEISTIGSRLNLNLELCFRAVTFFPGLNLASFVLLLNRKRLLGS